MKCGNCKGNHSTANEVKACYGQQSFDTKATPAPAAQVNGTIGGAPATPKQVAFINSLAQQRVVPVAGNTPEEALIIARIEDVMGGTNLVSKQEASKAIEWLLEQPKVEGNKPAPNGYAAEAKRGDVHFIDGTYYRIHMAQKSGNPYACKARITAAAVWAEDGTLQQAGEIEWDYCKGMIAELSKATLATAEQAAAFGKLVGRCCFCSHAIDTPESTAVGYGPVCASKYGLPWGATTQQVGA